MSLTAHTELSVDIASTDRVRTTSVACCLAVLPGWQNINNHESIQIAEVSGGITNKLWKITPPADSCLQPVLLRVYGDNTENFIDRERELFLISKLSPLGFGAPVLGTFANGRFEQFLAVQTMQSHQLLYPAVAQSIARRLAQFHTVDTGDKRMPTLFYTIWKWFDLAESLDFSENPEKHRLYVALNLPEKREDARKLQSLCEAFRSPVVFGHNDLLAGNVLLPAEVVVDPSPEAPLVPVQFIDFEYGAFSYRGFDWGNHFNECAGFECRWEQYPDKQQAERFISAYIKEARHTDEVSPQEVARGIAEANLFSLVSHVYWGVWAVLQAKWSQVDFSYLEYSHQRFERYADTRPSFTAAAEKLL